VPKPTDEITTREALGILGLAHASSVTRLVAEGKLTPSRKLPGANGAYLFHRRDIVRLAEQRRDDLLVRVAQLRVS
jgi:hypothetical protein